VYPFCHTLSLWKNKFANPVDIPLSSWESPQVGKENVMIRNSKQSWEVGAQVKVGFLNLKVLAKIATPRNWLPDQYALTDGRGRFYCFIPHNGLTRCASLEEAMIPAS
jgi:hypothetical protein